MTNLLRRLERSFTVDQVLVDLYSTGLAVLGPVGPSLRGWCSITNTFSLQENGNLERIAQLFNDPWAQGKHYGTLEFSPNLLPQVNFLLNSKLDPPAKLIYLIGLMTNKSRVMVEDLSKLIEEQPRPQDFPGELREEFSLYPGFFAPTYDLRRVNYPHLVAMLPYLHGNLTFEQYFKKPRPSFNLQDYSKSVFAPQVFKKYPRELVADLYPRQFVRFATRFVRQAPRELYPWLRSRFDQGIKLYGEDYSQQKDAYLSWRELLEFLTLEEADAFLGFAKRNSKNGLFFGRYYGVDAMAASLLAYYYLEGGEDRFLELCVHASQNSSFYGDRGKQFTRSWTNPYAPPRKTNTLSLSPYIQVIADKEFKDTPLEWALAVVS